MANTAYQSTNTGAQIDDAVTKVLTTGEIAKMVRDEIKAQLSAITTGVASVPVFDSTAVMKSMTIANFTNIVGNRYLGVLGSIPANSDLNSYTSYGFYQVGGAALSSVTNLPVSLAGRLEVKAFIDSSTYLQTYTTYSAPIRVFMRRRTSSQWGSWQEVNFVS